MDKQSQFIIFINIKILLNIKENYLIIIGEDILTCQRIVKFIKEASIAFFVCGSPKEFTHSCNIDMVI